MTISTVFSNNRTQAVRLPAELRFPESVKKVEVIALGRSRLVTPVDEVWDVWFDGEKVSDDFLQERQQPAQQEREGL